MITWSLGGPTVGGGERDGSMLGGARGEYLATIGGMAWAADYIGGITMWAIWGEGRYTLGFRVGGGALVAGVGKGVGKSGVVAMAVEGGGDENGGKLLNRSLIVQEMICVSADDQSST